MTPTSPPPATERPPGWFANRSLGVKFALLALWPRAIHEGNGKAALVVDPAVTDRQVDALTQICSGQLGGMPWEIMGPTVQVVGLVGRAGRLLAWLGADRRHGHVQRLDAALRDYYRRDWRRLSLSTGFHLAGWLLGAFEAYLILRFLAVPVDLTTATVIESLGAGVRFATFLVPASLGAFESANAAAFEAMGLGAGAGLAFSFVRRARQLVWVGIGLLVLVAMGWLGKRAELPGRVSTGASSSTSI